MAQSAYDSKMMEAQQKLNSSKTEADYNATADLFSEIASAQKTKWLPFYYAGLCKALAAIKLKTKSADALCNQADSFIHKCDSLNKDNAELYILKSLNFSARLNVNPAARAMKYNKQIHHANEMALKLDSSNPRVYLQKAQAAYYTPESFGGGAKKALPLYEVALEKFKAYKSDNAVMPHWGKDIAEKMIDECKAKLLQSSKK
jgi:hypothetical protein